MVGQRALVTGAGARLGREMALELAAMGYDVVVHYATSADGADETVSAIQKMGQHAGALQANLLDMSHVDALVPRAVDALDGPLSVLVNNASVFEYDNIKTATQSSWDRHMSSNLRAPFFLMQAFAAQAPKAVIDEHGESLPRALVVNMLDQRVQKPTPEFMTYSLAKSALWSLTRTAAQALAPHVRVNGIAPGTTLIGARQSQDHFDGQRAASLLRRGANVGDITAALTFFLNAPAVTGQMIAVDGGQHLAWETLDIRGVEKP